MNPYLLSRDLCSYVGEYIFLKRFYDSSLERCGELCILSSFSESIFHQFYSYRDPEFFYLRYQYRQAVASYIIKERNINMWVAINQVTSMSFSEFEDYDEFVQEAIYHAVSEVIEERNKQQKAVIDDLKKDDSNTPYISPMSQIAKPSFSF